MVVFRLTSPKQKTMKNLKSLLLAVPLTIFSLLNCGCNKDTTNDKLRDVTVTGNVSGAFSQAINFTLVSGNSNSGIGLSASRSSTLNKLSINIIGGGTWGLILGADATSIAVGSYSLGTGFSTYYNTGAGASQFVANAGTLQITSAESTSPLGTANDRYISGTFNATMINSDVPPAQIGVNGTFTNVFVTGP